jgi:hypothetical protein
MNVFSCRDKDGILIICDQSTWNNHIIFEHPEVKGCEVQVQTAITMPYQIYQDATNIDRKIIYRPFILPKPFHTQYLRVVIQYRKRVFGQIRGFVCTAFACTHVKFGDILLWEEKK